MDKYIGKPIFDTWNVVAERPLSVGSVNPVRALAITRIFEVVLDSLPQAFWQGYAIVRLDPSDRSTLMWASLIFSALSVAYMAMIFERDIDTSANYRKLFVKVHGYFPSSKLRKNMVALGIFLFISGFMTSKLIALAVIGVASSSGTSYTLTIWLTSECAVLFGLRWVSEGTFRFNVPGFDSGLGSLFVHVTMYLNFLACPSPYARFPGTRVCACRSVDNF